MLIKNVDGEDATPFRDIPYFILLIDYHQALGGGNVWFRFEYTRDDEENDSYVILHNEEAALQDVLVLGNTFILPLVAPSTNRARTRLHDY